MATLRAAPGEVVDLEHFADDLPAPHSKAILRTASLELARLVVRAGESMHPHGLCHVDGAVVIHCLRGAISLRVNGRESRLDAGQLVCLEGGVGHALSGLEDAVVLLTITFR